MKDKYPRSWEKFIREGEGTLLTDAEMFLDTKEICINVTRHKPGFVWDIWTTVGNRRGRNVFPDEETKTNTIRYYPERKDALRDAVDKGFEIYEGKLKRTPKNAKTA